MPSHHNHQQQEVVVDDEPKEDHRSINNQVSQYFNYSTDHDDVHNAVSNALIDVDLSSLNNDEFQIDPSITAPATTTTTSTVSTNEKASNSKDDETISAAAAAVAAYHQLQKEHQQQVNKPPQQSGINIHESNKITAVSISDISAVGHNKQSTTEDGFHFLDVPPGVDPKKMCRFCGKTFAYPGSLGRHLDNRKGSPLHPQEQIDKMRSSVARRGDPEAVKARRQLKAREYNRRDYVREKNRKRRKLQTKLSKSKTNTHLEFYSRLNSPTLPTHPSFPRMVLFFLPPSTWPHDPPTFQTFEILQLWLDSNNYIKDRLPMLSSNNNNSILSIDSYKEKLSNAYDNWISLSTEAKKEMWVREQRICAQEALGSLTLFDFAVRDKWYQQQYQQEQQQRHKETTNKRKSTSTTVTTATTATTTTNTGAMIGKEQQQQIQEPTFDPAFYAHDEAVIDPQIQNSIQQEQEQGQDEDEDEDDADENTDEDDDRDDKSDKPSKEERFAANELAAVAAVAAAAAAVVNERYDDESG